jgi:hypothetical protein
MAASTCCGPLRQRLLDCCSNFRQELISGDDVQDQDDTSLVEVKMSSTTTEKTAVPSGLDVRVLARILEEGYGPGAWHGADLKAALGDVPPKLAFWRPSPERHNIAEIALHHAYCTRSVRSQISGRPPEPFALDGEDWFDLSGSTSLSWAEVRAAVDTEQKRLTKAVADIGTGRVQSPLTEAERFDLVLGLTCHAVYHAGQVQLLKRLSNS